MRILVTCLALVAVWAVPARAENTAGQTLFESGRQAYREGRFEAAAHDFEEAYRLDHLPGLLFNEALALRKLWLLEPRREVLERAVGAYRAYLHEWPDGPRRKDAIDALAELAPLLERSAPAPAPPPPVEAKKPEEDKAAPAGAMPPADASVAAGPPSMMPPAAPLVPSGSRALVPPPQVPISTTNRRRGWVLPVVLGSIGGAALLAVAIGVGVTVSRNFASVTDKPSLGTVFFVLVRQ